MVILPANNNNNNNNNNNTKSRTKVVPVVVGALGLVSKKLAAYLEQLGIKDRTRTMQKSALLGSVHILIKVLEV